MAQDGTTPLHDAAGGLAAIKALLAAEADVHVKDDVRVGQGRWVAWRARGGGGGFGRHVTVVVWIVEPEVVERPNP